MYKRDEIRKKGNINSNFLNPIAFSLRKWEKETETHFMCKSCIHPKKRVGLRLIVILIFSSCTLLTEQLYLCVRREKMQTKGEICIL